jgi:FMN phosphatase YigB (HAD superfamily)
MVIEEVPAMLVELSTRYPLAIISDTGITPGRVLRQILEKDGVLGYFSHLTFSDELGWSKPHPEAFLSTLIALNARPDSAVHIGDLLRTDILGAQSVGMRAVQYIGVNQDDWSMQMEYAPKVSITPHAVISHHTELTGLLKQWSGCQANFCFDFYHQ